MNNFDIVIITHGWCMDGLSAAWIVRKYLQLHNIESYKIKYVFGTKRNLVTDIAPLNLADLKGKDIFITDYMYTYDELKDVECKSLTIIDHHESSIQECKKCGTLPMVSGNVYVQHDQSYSGAGLAWKILFPNTQMPWWIQYIQDRDLWKFQLPNSREINDAIYNLKYRTFAKFDELDSFTQAQIDWLIEQGKQISNIKNDIVSTISKYGHKCKFGNHIIYAIETGVLVSDVSDYIYNSDIKNEYDFIMCISYDFKERAYKCRLRSKEGTNVATIAEQYGGGGHINASGFSYKGNIFELLESI